MIAGSRERGRKIAARTGRRAAVRPATGASATAPVLAGLGCDAGSPVLMPGPVSISIDVDS
ncbi:hypothetical protein, partial [Burkholderia thailandensis]|uniref:hypothetical protein n=1 Tax=Burkholderia thailandensis TaxID=57975 RepID=UPI0021C63C06